MASVWAGLAAIWLVTSSCVLGGREQVLLPPTPPVVQVSMREYAFEYDPNVPLGRVVFDVLNVGTRDHALTFIKLPEDYPPIDEQLRGEERRPAEIVARVPSRPAGQGSRFAVDIEPGRYAMVCFVTDPDGVFHGLKGMNSEFRVPEPPGRPRVTTTRTPTTPPG